MFEQAIDLNNRVTGRFPDSRRSQIGRQALETVCFRHGREIVSTICSCAVPEMLGLKSLGRLEHQTDDQKFRCSCFVCSFMHSLDIFSREVAVMSLQCCNAVPGNI